MPLYCLKPSCSIFPATRDEFQLWNVESLVNRNQVKLLFVFFAESYLVISQVVLCLEFKFVILFVLTSDHHIWVFESVDILARGEEALNKLQLAFYLKVFRSNLICRIFGWRQHYQF